MIYAIVGGIGSGKTMFLTLLANWYYDSGYDIYANYMLKNIPFNNAEKIDDFLNIKSEKSFFALDEGWLSADSRQSVRNRLFTTQFLQSRKRKIDIGITLQDFGQIDVRIRNITQMVFEPEILKRDEYGKPQFIKMSYFDVTDDIRKTHNFIVPTALNFNRQGYVDIPNSYNTYEIVEEFEDATESNRHKIIKKYFNIFKENTGMKLKDLVSRMFIEDGVKTSEANQIATYIKWVMMNQGKLHF